MPEIHPTAVVGDDVELADGVEVGPCAVLEGRVEVDPHTSINSHVHIRGPAVIGSHNTFEVGCVIGTPPQDWSYEESSNTSVEIGSYNILREYVTVNRATTDGQATRIGNDNMIMAYSHVAHDCEVGNDIDVVNSVNLAGHVTLGDHVIVSGYTGFHQFVRVGDYAMIGGRSGIRKDVVPYATVSGDPPEIYGINSVGLRRHNFEPETRTLLKKAFKILFRDGNNTSQAIEKLCDQFDGEAPIRRLIEFVENSERGIHR